MGWWRTLVTWGNAPVPQPVPPPARQREERWSRPLSFSVNVPPEMAGFTGSGPPVPRVSREEALTVPAVKRVRDLIAGTLGTLPLCELDMGRNEVPNGLLEQPEADVARSVTMARTVEDMLFEGRAWWRITEFTPEGWPDKIVKLDARSVTVREQGRVYTSSTTGAAQGQVWTFVPDAELIRIDSPNDPLLVVGARAIRDCMALARAVTRNVDDPVPLGYFSPAGDVEPGDEEEIEEILDDWEDAVARRAWPYLNGALKANTLAWNPEQLQLGQARDAAILEIARLGGVDPEELGVSTTSRTYANAEQRRLDLIDFTLHAYVSAIEDRLSMLDVTVPGHRVWVEFDGFLRSDTLTRMQVYEAGRRVGVYNDARIAKIERIPSARVQADVQASAGNGAADSARAVAELIQKIYLGVGVVLTADEARTLANRAGAGLVGSMPAAAAPAVAPADPPSPEETVQHTLAPEGARFTAAVDAPLVFGFDLTPDQVQFKADPVKRTVSGLVLPWNVAARSMGFTWMFAPNSLHWASESRVKLDKDHGYGSEMGAGKVLTNTTVGLAGAFGVARGDSGDQALMLAEDGVYDGFSAFVTFDGEADGWIPHPDNDSVRYVQQATLRKVALTAMPAFDDARVQHVAATRNGAPMTAPVTTPTAPTAVTDPPAAPAPVPAAAPFDMAAFTAGLTESMKAFATELVQQLPAPQRAVIPAGRMQTTVKEPLVYQMNGRGPSFVRDAWKSRTEGDPEARDRLMKFESQTTALLNDAMADPTFAINTGNAAAVIPPGYRPDLFVSQLLKGRPLTNAVSRGTIGDATPFTVPRFVSSTGATADHVEGVNPTEGSLVVEPVTISPSGVSGLYKITREMADSANPAIDAIATQAMSEDYSQRTEAKVYAKLNGTDGVGGTITAGFVPSGAQATAVTEDISDATNGKVFLAGIRAAMALYPFRRFAAPDFAMLSQEGTTTAASAVDTTGRPLLPWVGAQNAVGTANTLTQGYLVDGLTFQPAWSMSGNAAGDSDVIIGNRNDVWAWESPTLMFRFEERSGPAFVELALFGYFAVQVLRPVGLAGIRLTIQA